MYMHVAASCDVCAISCDVDKLLFIVYCLVDSTKLFSRGYIFLESVPNIDITSKYLLYYEELKSTLDITDLIKIFYLHLIHFDTRPLQLNNSD